MRILKEQRSADNAIKYLVGLDDRQSVEALYMHDSENRLTYHSTVCVSSQVGCAMGCLFCATGEQGFIRNLTAGEIAGQVDICDKGRRAGCPPIDAVVFAGMGEPLLNYDAVVAAIERIHNERGLCHFELATVGVVPRMYDLGRHFKNSSIGVRLNLSLHAPTDEKRLALMPYTKTHGVREIIEAADAYAGLTKTTARVRYMLIRGMNDTDEDIEALVALLKGRPLKLIISRYNDNNIKSLTPTSALEVLDFYNKIKGRIDCDVFHNFGETIQGGCGQLRQSADGTRAQIL